MFLCDRCCGVGWVGQVGGVAQLHCHSQPEMRLSFAVTNIFDLVMMFILKDYIRSLSHLG